MNRNIKLNIGDKVTLRTKITDLVSSFFPNYGFIGEVVDYMNIEGNGFFYIVNINGCNCPARENEIELVKE